MFRNKIPVGRIIPSVFSEKVQNLTVFFFFKYLHDSNSIFRARGINSERVSDCAVMQQECRTDFFDCSICEF